MSYEVTATRRRPQQFDDLVGQEFVAATLKNAIKSEKIAHAYLFTGPRGCGKTSTARILAKALNCQHGPTDHPCGECSNCREITNGSSLDVIEIDGASNNNVDNIRQIKDEVSFPPTNSKYKIYIIDEVHMLSTSAFNALLKTIEEPPPHVIFIFATTELQKVPATIKSRCQQFNFRLVAIDKVKQCLADAAAELGIQADDEALFWIARESTGSMRDAYTLFDQVVAFSEGHITYEKIRDKLGLVGIDRLNTLFEACAAQKSEDVINMLDEYLQAGVSIEQLISNSADYLRSLLLIKSGVSKESLLGNAAERFSQQVLQAWSPVQIERALSIFLQLYRDIRYSLSPRYELELAFSRMCWIGSYVSAAEVKKAIDAASALLGGQPGGLASPVGFQPQYGGTQQGQTSQVSQSSQTVQQAQQFQQPQSDQLAPVSSNPLPNGLPQLSMLSGGFDDDGAGDDTEPSEEGDQNPFHNGGPLPPEQPAGLTGGEMPQSGNANGAGGPLPQIQMAEVGGAVSQQAGPVFEVPDLPASGFPENPDGEDFGDSWSNVDEIPDDGYSDEDFASQAEQEYEAFQAAPVEEESRPQLEDSFTTADGRRLSVAQLRGSVMAALSVNDGFAASNLEKTGLWKVSQGNVSTTVSSEYDLELLKKKLPVIERELSSACGCQMTMQVSLEERDRSPAENVKIPDQVQILVDVFKGSIVAGKK